MRARTNISLKDRKSLTLSDFKGVDFSSSPLRVKNNRATSMRNFINEYGVNKKRNGWRELLNLEEEINGIFQFGDDIIVYARTRFYKVTESKGIYQSEEIELAKIDTSRLEPNRIQAFYNKGKAYIIGCGDYLVYGKWGDSYELRRVADVAYVPTTTISIDNDSVKDDARATLDDVNCLSSRRINQLVGVSEKVWTLKNPIEANTLVTISLEKQKTESEKETITITNGETETAYGENLYSISGGTKTVWGRVDFGSQDKNTNGKIIVPYATLAKEAYTKISVLYNKDKSEELSFSSSIQWTLDTSIDAGLVEIRLETLEGDDAVSYTINNEIADSEYGETLYKIKKMQGETATTLQEPCGTIDYGDENKNAKIILTCPTAPQIENRDNIFVTFYHKNINYENRITKCKFGTLFGVEGNTDRLFLSGNPDYPNMDFHSEEDDYTYFSDLGSAALGSDAVAIKGYGRLSDSNLVIYKEESGQETSIFYRTGYYDTKYDSKGNVESKRGIFPHKAGSIGEGCASTYACVNFAGDNLLLSSNGVFGVVLASNVATAERYTRERSRTINERLRKHQNLSEAVGIVYKNRYYLSVDDVCYVADARYKFTAEDDLEGSYNYEWWYWDNIPARVFANIDGNLYFGTKDGRICVFDDKYTDRTYTCCDEYGVSLDINKNHITYSNNMQLSDNDIVTFNAALYSLVLSSTDLTVKDGKVKVPVKYDENNNEIYDIFNIREGMEVYVDNIELTNLEVNKKYIVREVDPGDCTFVLCHEDNEKIDLADGSFNIYQLHQGQELYVTNVTLDDFQVKQYKAGEVLTLSPYNDTLPTLTQATFRHFKNVVAEWYTPIFDLGTNESSKTLLKMTLSTVPETNGKVSFGYTTRNVDKVIAAKGIHVFSLDNFSFENFTLNPTFANSYSVKCNERNFNFIAFRFYSDNDSDCRVNALTIIYKINKSNRGVM